MDMPITKPSMVAYADELEFTQLLEELTETKKNGFIRVTSGSEEGYLLFKDGKQVAASYDNLSKLEAIDKIKSSMDDYKTLVEVFDIRASQVSYLMDLNKPYILEKVPNTEDVLETLKKNGEIDSVKDESSQRESTQISETVTQRSEEAMAAEKVLTTETSPDDNVEEVAKENETAATDSENIIEEESSISSDEITGTSEREEITTTSNPIATAPNTPPETSPDETENPTELTENSTPEKEGNFKTILEEIKSDETPDRADVSNTNSSGEVSPDENEEITSREPEEVGKMVMDESSEVTEGSVETEPEVPVDRLELMKKYGIKDIDEEDVEKVLESYTGGYLSDNDVEKVELTLMNRIKKSIMGLPKVKGTEVMIFLDNAGNDLRGNINVIMEYQPQGLLSRIVGGSKETNTLKRQVIGICNMEIRKIFREYPEVVDKFEINVEIS